MASYRLMLKKIVILGPESTGKSTLCQQLALHYRTAWCPEYAREYLNRHGTSYTYDDLLTIARGQLELEDRYTAMMPDSGSTPVPLFIDTDMYVMKTWSEYVFGKCHRFILDQVVERKYDLYLLCQTDIPWTKDELREYPDPGIRRRLFSIYKDLLLNQPVPWQEIHGDFNERLQLAVTAVNALLH